MEESVGDGLERSVLERLPLAEAVWLLMRHVCEPGLLEQLFESHRSSGWTGKISFGLLVDVVRDALVQHHGSGLQAVDAARQDGRLTASAGAFYGKLRRVPPSLSEAFLAATTARLRELRGHGCSRSAVPVSLANFAVLVVDGKKLKNLARRLKPLRAHRGRALGGKALVALLLNHGLVLAMNASLDGEANDAPLTPGLLDQMSGLLEGQPRLYVADRQFCDLTIPTAILARGDQFLIRFSRKMRFQADETSVWQDRSGRTVTEEWGWLGHPDDSRRMQVRRLTLQRTGEEDVIIITSLMDAGVYPGQDLLDVYLQRWSIERVFQQITEVFSLDRLISSSPQGAVFQFALCCLLYNLVILLRGWIAEAQQRPEQELSSENLFRDMRNEMVACCKLVETERMTDALRPAENGPELETYLRHRLQNHWSPRWIKARRTTTRPAQTQPTITHRGGHFSAWKALRQAHQQNKARAP